MNRVLGLLIVAALVMASFSTTFAQDATQRKGVVVKLAGEVVESFESLAEAVPGEWRASSESVARYEVLLTGFTSEGKTCDYEHGSTLIRTQIDVEAVITDLVTGEILANDRFEGYMPNCPPTTGGSGNTYARPPLGAVIAWLFATMTAHTDLGGVPLILPHRVSVTTASFSPDGRTIVTGTADIRGIGEEHDGLGRVWDAQTGEELVQLWDMQTGEELVQLFMFSAGITTAIFSSDGRTILTASQEDNTVRLWDAETGGMLLEVADVSVEDASFSPDGRTFLTVASRLYVVQLWDVVTGEELLRLSKDAPYVNNASFSPDGRTIVTVSRMDGATLWDAQTGDELFYIASPMVVTETSISESGFVTHSAVFSPDGRILLTTGKEARVWNAVTGQEVLQLTGHKQTASNAIFSPDGTVILTTDVDTARVWDAETGNMRCQLEGSVYWADIVTFSSDGRIILTKSGGQRVMWLWDAETCKELGFLVGHTDSITSASFSPDGQTILTTSADQTARIWDVSVLVDTP